MFPGTLPFHQFLDRFVEVNTCSFAFSEDISRLSLKHHQSSNHAWYRVKILPTSMSLWESLAASPQHGLGLLEGVYDRWLLESNLFEASSLPLYIKFISCPLDCLHHASFRGLLSYTVHTFWRLNMASQESLFNDGYVNGKKSAINGYSSVFEWDIVEMVDCSAKITRGDQSSAPAVPPKIT